MTAKMISFSSPDGRKVESVRVAVTGLALRATGYIVSTEDPAYGASYSIVVDGDGRTRRIAVRCDDESGERSLSLTRSPGGPWIADSVSGSEPMPQLGDATDVFLIDSALAASLPVRRLKLHTTAGAEAEVVVAAISLPDLEIHASTHHGRTREVTEKGAVIDYSGPFGSRTVVVDDEGLLARPADVVERVG